MIRSFLEFEGHTVDICYSGADGLFHILEKVYDLVILDWDLPEVNGIEILERFRQSGAATAVIMLTGKTSVEDKEVGLDLGADDYLTKPFNMKELGARVRAHLRRSNPTGALRLGDISLDEKAKRARRGGELYALSPREYTLLEMAAKYPHWKPSKEELIKQVFEDGGEENLRMAIRRLRKKLDPKGGLIFPQLYSDALLADSEGPPLLGTIIGDKYELVEFLGGGGSGTVYRAKHCELGSEAAIKLLHVGTQNLDESVSRFEREAQIMGKLSHDCIVSVRDFGKTNQGQPYIVMDLIRGRSLKELLEQHSTPAPAAIVSIFICVLEALSYAHSQGILHRDLKPSNIILEQKSTLAVKLLDFGMAKEITASGDLAKITVTGQIFGSAPYMSPEQCRGETLTQTSDIYSLGVSLFETLTGTPPFCGKDIIDTIMQHINSPAPKLALPEGNQELENALNGVIQKCLSKAREDRYQSASALQEALRCCLSL